MGKNTTPIVGDVRVYCSEICRKMSLNVPKCPILTRRCLHGLFFTFFLRSLNFDR